MCFGVVSVLIHRLEAKQSLALHMGLDSLEVCLGIDSWPADVLKLYFSWERLPGGRRGGITLPFPFAQTGGNSITSCPESC